MPSTRSNRSRSDNGDWVIVASRRCCSSTRLMISGQPRRRSSDSSNQSSPSSTKGSRAFPVSRPITERTHQAWCSAISAMLWRPGPGRQNAAGGKTSARAAFKSGPCQAPAPYPSARIRVVMLGSSAVAVLMMSSLFRVSTGVASQTPARRCLSTLPSRRGFVLGKIAVDLVDLEQALARRAVSGAAGRTAGRLLARGDGWSVDDVICTFGPADHPFEERHAAVSIAVVVAGSFEYRSSFGSALMTPGSFLLGNSGQCFECGHAHAAGDRCVAFRYAPGYFERLAADVGAPRGERGFRISRLPPLRESAALVARAATGGVTSLDGSWGELAFRVAGAALRLASGLPRNRGTVPAGAAP